LSNNNYDCSFIFLTVFEVYRTIMANRKPVSNTMLLFICFFEPNFWHKGKDGFVLWKNLPVLLIFFSFCCCPIVCLYVLGSMLWCPLGFPHKTDVQFVGQLSFLHFLCLFAHSGVQHILCCVFVMFFFVLCTLMLLVYLDCLLLIARSVFSNVYFIDFKLCQHINNNDFVYNIYICRN
jgi:hypothetical protein